MIASRMVRPWLAARALMRRLSAADRRTNIGFISRFSGLGMVMILIIKIIMFIMIITAPDNLDNQAYHPPLSKQVIYNYALTSISSAVPLII
jgi:hypothetical protein